MNQELKSHSAIGDREGIMFFAKHVLTKDKVILSSLKEQCQVNQSISLNFGCAVEAFSYLGITEHNTRSIQSTGIIKNPNDDNELKSRICGRCIDVLLRESLIDINKVSFNEANMLFSLPKGAFSFDSAIFRNMLITLGYFSLRNGIYFVEPADANEFAEKVVERRKKVTIEQLRKTLEFEQRVGDAGEEFVLRFEKNRLHPEKARMVMRISQVDVAAGYDIVSLQDNDSASIDRFIEVKTYIGKKHFHWSSNEIDVAKLRRNLYHLCLVDYEKIDEPGYMPEYIQNPYENVFDSSSWLREPDSYTFSPVDRNE